MRLFTGIDLPAPVVERLAALLERLRPTARLKWTPVENLHITTKFIGEWPKDDLGRLETALGTLPKREPVAIVVDGLGWFPNPHSPRTFWAAVHGGTALGELARDVENVLEPLSIARDNRPFSPHLTLARISQQANLTATRQAIASLDSVEFGQFQADRVF